MSYFELLKKSGDNLMKIIPLASESLGTRGLSVYVETEDQKIIIDPSVSLGPFRNGYPPHLLELAAAFLSRYFIMKFWEKANIIIQTHYHADHYSLRIKRSYEFTNHDIAKRLYSHPKKVILAKDLRKNINYNQKKRATWLWNRKSVQLFAADGNTFVFGRTRVMFSKPLPHGSVGTKQGWVISVLIKDSFESVLITSDVSGPGSDIALRFIIENPVDLAIIDGPSTYHPRQTVEEIEQAFQRLERALEISPAIIDHHLLRDSKWKELCENRGISSEKITLASLLGLSPTCLEYKRSQLFNQAPLDSSFHRKFEANDISVLEEINKTARTYPLWSKLSNILNDS
jgi:predicted metallo-beta-lactamase superfamily hydrolase